MKEATKKQKEVLNFIALFIEANGYSPSFAEIAHHFGIYPNAAHDFVSALAKKGHLSVSKGRARGISIGSTSPITLDRVRKVASICLGPKNFSVLMSNLEQSLVSERAK